MIAREKGEKDRFICSRCESIIRPNIHLMRLMFNEFVRISSDIMKCVFRIKADFLVNLTIWLHGKELKLRKDHNIGLNLCIVANSNTTQTTPL